MGSPKATLLLGLVAALTAPELSLCQWQRCGYVKDAGLLCSDVPMECGKPSELALIIAATKKGAVKYDCGPEVRCDLKNTWMR